MTDLVEKLRATADGDCREVARDLCFEAKDGDEWAELMERAADEIERLRADADRYNWLRSRDLDTISKGGVFAGMTPENVILNEEDLDRAIDAAMNSN